MFCPQCGTKLIDSAKYCSKCGAQVTAPQVNSNTDNDTAGYDYNQDINGNDSGYDNGGSYDYGESFGNNNGYDYGNNNGYDYGGGNGSSGTGSSERQTGLKNKSLIIILAVLGTVLMVLIGVFIAMLMGNSGGSNGTGSGGSGGTGSNVSDSSGSGSNVSDSSGSSGSNGSNGSSDTPLFNIFNKEKTFEDAMVKGDRKQSELQLISSDVEDYPTVKLYYNLQDSAGTPVIMTSPTAYIKETISGGAEIERKVKSVSRLSGNQGVGIDILIDKSGSMEDDFYTMQSVLRDFINSLDYDSGDSAELIAFDSLIMYMCTYTNDRAKLLNGVENMSTSGLTALYDALISGITNAGNRAGANCVIAFTDGADNESYNTYYDVITLAQQKEVPVYLIGTYDAEESVLRNIASSTGGRYWNVHSINDVGDILDEIYRLQKDMYCVEYISDETADPYANRYVSCVIGDEINYAYEPSASFTAVETITVKPHTSRYEVIQGDVSWTEANNICIANGGHLATITSQSEMNQVCNLAERSGLKYIWIGGYTSLRGGSAYGHWITGEDFNFTAWYPGEPSRNDHDGTPEAYLMLWRVEGVWSWNDQRNDLFSTGLSYFAGNVGYICEYES